MDRQVEQTERVLDLAGYVPEFLREIREFQQLYGAQESELKRLYEKMDELWKDSLIPVATIQGIRRFEKMMGLKSYPGDTLEERRASVSLEWNQQLPYTLPRLRERLEVVAGDDYTLWVRGSAYELELQVIDQPYRVLQVLRDMTRQMIPAHLRFIFAGKYPAKIPTEVTAGTRLELASDFYARYNREFLYMNGSWLLDGCYPLNGYKEIEGLELYPVRAVIRGEWLMPVALTWRVGYRAGVEELTEIGTNLRIASETAERPAGDAGMGLAWVQPVALGIGGHLTVEKDLWHLDGSYLLDGTKLLDAEIFEYEL